MRIVILFTLLAVSARALPTSDRILLTREQLNNKAEEVESIVAFIDRIKRIAVVPRDEVDWEHPDSNARDIEAFLATTDLLKSLANYIDWQSDSRERSTEEFLDILHHLRSWVLATGGDMEQLHFQEHEKNDYTAVLSFIEEVENYVSDKARNNDGLLKQLDFIRSTTLNGGDRGRDSHEYDDAFQAVYNVIMATETFDDAK